MLLVLGNQISECLSGIKRKKTTSNEVLIMSNLWVFKKNEP